MKAKRQAEDSLPEIPKHRRTETNMVQTYITVAAVLVTMCMAVVFFSGKKPAADPKDDPKSQAQLDGAEQVLPVEPKPEPKLEPKPVQQVAEIKTPLTVALAPASNEKSNPDPREALAPKQSREILTRSVTLGLREALAKGKDHRGKLADLPEQLNQKGLTAKLISPISLNLTVKEGRTDPAGKVNLQGSMLDLKLTCTDVDANTKQANELHLEIGNGAIWIFVPATNTEEGASDLIDRLRFSLLEMRTAEADPFVLRIGFMPQMPAIPLSGLQSVDGAQFKLGQPDQGRDVKELLMAVNRWKYEVQSPLEITLQINRITLAMLHNQNAGWPLTNVVKTDFKTQLPTDFRLAIAPDGPGSPEIAGKLKVDTHFDREIASEKPAVAAELKFPVPPPVPQAVDHDSSKKNEVVASEPEMPDPNNKEAVKAWKAKKMKEAKEARDAKAAETKAKAEAKKAKKAGDPELKTPEKTTEKEGADKPPPPKIEEPPLSDLANEAILNELFRRYGRLDARLVIRMPANSEFPEIVILRFGE
ncbi:MAG: hypothetical protein JWM11_366, partial [Planctomycetaceae bacterium]|nr:hypothetical protein [Planctomycetaceae bacterium]